MSDCQVKCVVWVISHFPVTSHGFLPGLRECRAPGILPFAASLSSLLWGSATPFCCTLPREIMPQTYTALRKPSTNTNMNLLSLPILFSLTIVAALSNPFLFAVQQHWGSCPPELVLFPRPGVTRRRGYIWLFIKKSLGTHTHCYLHDAAWHLSGSHIVLTRTWYCLRCMRAFLDCLSISPPAALHLLTSFAPHTPPACHRRCVCVCALHHRGGLWGGTWVRHRDLGENSPWWCWWHSCSYVAPST